MHGLVCSTCHGELNKLAYFSNLTWLFAAYTDCDYRHHANTISVWRASRSGWLKARRLAQPAETLSQQSLLPTLVSTQPLPRPSEWPSKECVSLATSATLSASGTKTALMRLSPLQEQSELAGLMQPVAESWSPCQMITLVLFLQKLILEAW